MITRKRTERGQALILIAVGIMGLLGITALAVDGGNAFMDRRHAQNAADTAALAAALEYIRDYAGDDGDGVSWQGAGLALAATNGYNNNGSSNTVQVLNPPVSGPYAGNNEYIQVIINSNIQTAFGNVIGVTQVSNQVQAVAKAKPGTSGQMYFGNAVVALKPTGTSTFRLHGNPSATAIGGGFFVNSSTNCGFTVNGNPSFSTPAITMVAGQSCPMMAGTGINYNAPQFPYPPPAEMFPNYTCNYNWSGNFPPNGVTTLQPGVHCVNGNFRLNGNDTLSGTEVTIVLQSGDIRLNGNGVLNLSAPTSGPTAGLLIFMPMSNTNEIRINGTNDQTLIGTIFAPAAPIVMLGTASTDAFQSQMIGYTIQFGGTFDGVIRYNDAQNYDAAIPPEIELAN